MQIRQFHKSAKFSLIETKSSGGSFFGVQIRDGNPIPLSSDRDEALDFIYKLQRKEAALEYFGQPSAWYTNCRFSDEVSDDEPLTSSDDLGDAEDTDDAL